MPVKLNRKKPYKVCFCLFVVLHPSLEFISNMETSPLTVKGCKFWSILGTYEGSLACGTYCDIDISPFNGRQGPVTFSPVAIFGYRATVVALKEKILKVLKMHKEFVS